MMDKYLITFRNIALPAGFFFLLLAVGCGDQAETPSEPKMVSQKIIAPKDTVTPPKKIEVPVSEPTIQPEAAIAKKEVEKTTKEPEVTASEKPEMVVSQKIIAPQDDTVKQPEKTEPAISESEAEKPEADLAAPPAGEEFDETEKQVIASISVMAQKKKSLDTTDVYNPEGKIDPFAPLFKEEQAVRAGEGKREERIPLTPIEKVDLSQLKLVGVIRAPSGNKAMVEESSGKGYIVTEGTPIGIHWGKVFEILNDSIIVEEEVEDIYGNITKQKRELKLQKPLGEI